MLLQHRSAKQRAFASVTSLAPRMTWTLSGSSSWKRITKQGMAPCTAALVTALIQFCLLLILLLVLKCYCSKSLHPTLQGGPISVLEPDLVALILPCYACVLQCTKAADSRHPSRSMPVLRLYAVNHASDL